MILIKNWQDTNFRCYFCGTDKSVKYLMNVNDPTISNEVTAVCVCNKCAIFYAPNLNEEE